LSIFNKETLERLNSPEQLDTALHIRSPMAWVILGVVGMLAVLLLIWSVAGSLQQRVEGLGMVMPAQGDVFRIEARATGELLALKVRVGSMVKKGQVVAQVSQDIMRMRLNDARALLRDLEGELTSQRSFYQSDASQQGHSLKQDISSLRDKLKAQENHRRFLEQTKRSQQQDLKRGFITRDQFEQTLDKLSQVDIGMMETKLAIQKAEIVQQQASDSRRVSLDTLSQQVLNARNLVRQREAELEIGSKVVSPVAGQVLELDAKPGDTLVPGTSLIKMTPMDHKVVVRLYVKPQDGKEISPGMLVHVAPTSVESSVYGTMTGRVQWVSDLPESRPALMDIFEDSQMVSEMTSQGAPFAVIVSLDRDATTYSGYRWTSSNGPRVHINPGTLCSASVIVREQHPINLVVPLFKSWIPLH
jgi:HlyD family secretion protein